MTVQNTTPQTVVRESDERSAFDALQTGISFAKRGQRALGPLVNNHKIKPFEALRINQRVIDSFQQNHRSQGISDTDRSKGI
jgi:hypothetical protein